MSDQAFEGVPGDRHYLSLPPDEPPAPKVRPPSEQIDAIRAELADRRKAVNMALAMLSAEAARIADLEIALNNLSVDLARVGA